ncbi:MAG: hypothetical protein VKJ64_17305 [Leptolyngbyaceae bacterium]|nr:hypothetical protein [Leptolyngbyaceae bacterium]
MATAKLADPSPPNALHTLRQYPLWHGVTSVQRQSWPRHHLIQPIAARFQRQYGFRQEQAMDSSLATTMSSVFQRTCDISNLTRCL